MKLGCVGILQEDLLRSFEEEQLSMHTPRPVWKLRDQPPQDWSNPDPGGLNSNSGGPDIEGPYSGVPEHNGEGNR